MIKKIVIFTVFVLTVVVNAFAELPSFNLKKNEVAVITKVSVNTKSNMDFFNKTFGCTEEDLARNNNYFLPIIFPKSSTYNKGYVEWFENIEEAEDGQYCVSIYTLPANRTLYFTSGIRYLYHKLDAMEIELPAFFKVQIPEDVQCVYIGDLNYTVEGDRFETTNLTLTDSFDQAVEFAKTVNGLKKETLCRAEINPIVEADLDNIVTEFSVQDARTVYSKLNNGVYSYRK